MLHFENDYNQGAHPELLAILLETNQSHQSGYGYDDFSKRAIDKIKKVIDCPHAQIQFLAGGTQTNQIAINSLLKSYEGVISADSGHIAVHEAGAIELTGHKVITLPNHDGKLDAAEVAQYLEEFYQNETHEHMVFPGMVYITHPTEYGTLYTKTELQNLADTCRRYDIPLYLDGARLGYGLVVEDSDVTLKTIADCCDVFYIGGTKLGALIGEALIYTKQNMPKHFNSFVKQHGALLAKGRIVGLQFDRLFTDNLYFEIGKYTLDLTKQLKNILQEKQYPFYIDSPTNQQFIIVKNDKLDELKKDLVYSFWDKYDNDHTVIRLVTSWSTSQKDIDRIREIL